MVIEKQNRYPKYSLRTRCLAYKLENGLLKLVESLERKRDQGDWVDSLVVKESNAVYGKRLTQYSITPILHYLISLSPLSKSPSLPITSSSLSQPLVEPLTNRELDILDLLAQRLQNKEIADKLFISPETVKTHLNNIYQKLSVTNRRLAVENAKKIGIL